MGNEEILFQTYGEEGQNCLIKLIIEILKINLEIIEVNRDSVNNYEFKPET